MDFDIELYDRIRSRLMSLREYAEKNRAEAESNSGLPLAELIARIDQVIQGFELGVLARLTLHYSPAVYPHGAIWAGPLVPGPTDGDMVN